jgi:glycosyltransferase involved in cell wall biosynthesis
VQATDVGGTHPALLEAMAAGLPILANDIPEHREVLGGAGWYYRKNSAADLAARMRAVLIDEGGAALRASQGEAARRRVRELYDWESVAQAYEDLARRLLDEHR